MTTLYQKLQHLYLKILRIGLSSMRGFSTDDCFSKASALTYYSLLSVVPVLAVGFGIARGFGFEKPLEQELMQKFSDQREVAETLITFAYKTLENTQSGLIAFVGLIVLFWSVLKLLSSIEASFNAIWKHAKPRTFSRRFNDYFAMMLFCPIFFIAASSLLVFVISEIVYFSKTFDTWNTLSPLFSVTIHMIPLVISWMLFTIVYYAMPNTKVPLSVAFTAGIVAGTAYQVVQWVYIQFQIGVASYGAIYGSLAALPLFLIWINTSWLVALAGAEIAYHTENDIPVNGSSRERYSRVDKRMLGLILIQKCIHEFNKNTPPPTIYELAHYVSISTDVVRHIIKKLINAGLIVEVNWKDGDYCHYQPGRLPKNIRLNDICDALDDARHEYYFIDSDIQLQELQHVINEMDTVIEKEQINIPCVLEDS